MDWDAIGAIGEVLGAAAVVATLLYLARQTAQANRIAKAAVARELSQKYSNLYELIASDPGISGLVTRLRDPLFKAKSVEEEERVENFCLLVAGIWLSTGAAHEQGQIDQKTYRLFSDDVQAKLSRYPGMRSHMKKVAQEHPGGEEFEILKPLFQELFPEGTG